MDRDGLLPGFVGDPVRPDLAEEMLAYRSGARCVAGVDEVGRGALGGPVLAAAVVLPYDSPSLLEALSAVRDSKVLSAAARIESADNIRRIATSIGIGRAEPLEIDVMGIGRATALAMARALDALTPSPDLVLVDGFPVPFLRVRQRALVRGDARVLSIAAASVVAKVTRDALMIALSRWCTVYDWHAHKGYGAPSHLRALAVHGPSVHHRLTWACVAREAR
jgi:ribonuclease HII